MEIEPVEGEETEKRTQCGGGRSSGDQKGWVGRGGCAERKEAALGGAKVGAPQCLPSLPASFSE